MINIYDPEFVGDQLTKLYEAGFAGGADKVLVRFLAMVNTGFLPAAMYAKGLVLETAPQSGLWNRAKELAGEALGRIGKAYRESVGEQTLAGLDRYFAGLQNGRIKAVRFSLADKNRDRIIREVAMLEFFSEPDALESGRFHFIPAKDKEPQGLPSSGHLQFLLYEAPARRPDYPGAGPSGGYYLYPGDPQDSAYSLCTYPERKNPKEVAKMAGDIFKLPSELFLVAA
ncbi:MAG: hypothetical protein HY517_02085 [Candidatus Aenigmarchaeota archaeon]|nr:hypothetical protein [Candidatus Aenigmarchaeota archaeon]